MLAQVQPREYSTWFTTVGRSASYTQKVTSTRSRVVLLHGFAQTANCWSTTAVQEALWRRIAGPTTEISAPTLPGHGSNPGVLDPLATLWTVANQLESELGAGTYLGYSFGGRLALHAALEHPEAVKRLILVSATPGIADTADRAARQHEDAALAERIEQIGVSAFITEWLALAMFEGLSDSARFLEERQRNTAAGLAWALKRLGTGSQDNLWARLAELSMPVLVLTGTQDEKFAEIGDQMCSAIGSNASRVSVDGAGHSAHLEQPEQFARAVSEWLATT